MNRTPRSATLPLPVRRTITRRGLWFVVLATVLALLVGALQAVASAPARADAGSPCGATINPIVCENRQTGTPESVWDDVDGAGDDAIQGFTTDVSANVGGQVNFKITTTVSAYTIVIYRLGYYQGNGARKIATITPNVALAQHQPTCLTDAATQLYDCGDWGVSASWTVPTTAVSGVYIADLVRTDTGDMSQIPFVVRNDASHSDVVMQTSDATWQAYNAYGGSDFYTGNQQLTNSQARAFKISYNRPYITRGDNQGRDYLFSNEYPTLRFLERNGYDVSYITDVDTARAGSLLTNHKVFMSVGHDEYWSQSQRDNVVAARDKGVNLMFLSGNEMYWRTRYEPSIDGSNTAYRTITCYKETWDNAPTDPVDSSTSTYRDPRFQTGSLGGNPENGVTGTMFMSNSDDLAIQVSGAEGKLRLWRNTTLGSVSNTTVTTLAAHTIGYESDEDVDNGFRPAGLIDLSTTTGATPMELQDFGLVTKAGTTTHHLTLYRAASGALVFGAGTIQWGWGLDADHDGYANVAADARMQQATVNMLADMKALASTIQSGLVASTTSTDTTAPTAVISSPAAGASIANGASVTVSGTATDAGGGQVAGVEVSMDGGSTWHPATGRASWTYTGVLRGTGTSNILARATDDSANLQATPTARSVTVNCPCTLYGSQAPAVADAGDASPVTLGTRFTADRSGFVTGMRFYKASNNTGTHPGTLWSASGQVLATGTFTAETSSGWQTLQFSNSVAVTAGTVYVVGYYAPVGHYSDTVNTFYYKDYNATPLHAAPFSPTTDQVAGVYANGNAFPTQNFSASSYWVDPIFSVQDTRPPAVTTVSPQAAATGATGSAITATFGGAVAPGSVVFTVTSGTTTVTGTTSYDAPSTTATFTLPQAFTPGAAYSVKLTATGTNGLAMTTPYTWVFKAAGPADGSCPCSIYPDSNVPTTAADVDTSSTELGIKFTADTNGTIAGIKFYKGPGNTGTHTGTLWSSTGSVLATTTFTQETAGGWQYAAFSTPVAVTAGTTYTASYHAPVGHYSATSGEVASAGINRFPLHVAVQGAVYTYGSTAPTSASNSTYGVDVLFVVPAATVPTVTSVSPASGATSVPTQVGVTATFDNSVTSSTPVVTVTPSGGSALAGTTTLDPTQHTVTFTPTSPLATGTTFQVTVSGAKSLGGTVQTAKAWSFTTGSSSGVPAGQTLLPTAGVPATIDSGDAGPISLGVRFQSNTAGTITGVRFYKAATNTGVHTASLWNAGGTRLATATFFGESASGWQTVAFSSPVTITANTVYVVSYYTPTGHYSVDSNYFANPVTSGALTAPGGTNGVYLYGSDGFPASSYSSGNYWVDPVFNAAPAAPAVTGQTPLAGSSSVAPTVAPSTSYSVALSPSTLTASVTQQVGSGTATAVSGAVTYTAASNTVTFTPATAFTAGAAVTVTVNGTLADGVTAAPTSTWSFTVAQPPPTPGVCPCSLWSDGTVPAVITENDPAGVELGTAFTADVAGSITGVSFYKGPKNTGTHTVYLLDGTGARLATATVTSESTTGWQTALFATPVAIAANTVYTVSYYTSVGYYSDTGNGFSSPIDISPLHVAAGSSGRYIYRTATATTTATNASNANYWVQPVFTR